MGKPTPPPPVYGNDCDTCEPDLWADGKTPKFVTVTFSALEKCPLFPLPAPNTSFVLEQSAAYPCEWLMTSSGYSCKWLHGSAASEMHLTYDDGAHIWNCFYNYATPKCQTSFSNEWTSCSGYIGCKYGFAVVTW